MLLRVGKIISIKTKIKNIKVMVRVNKAEIQQLSTDTRSKQYLSTEIGKNCYALEDSDNRQKTTVAG